MTTVAPDPLRLVGTICERKYRVDRVVAEGGFSIVYAAWHLERQLPVALKVLRPNLQTSRDDWADLVHQFHEEATALTRLRRSHVVAVLDSGVAPLHDDPMGLAWMALEWLDGETLREDLAARRGEGGRTRAETMTLLRPVIETIAEAHDLGIAHRDLKPSNIMLEPAPGGVRARVLDFGIAKVVERGTNEPASADTSTDSHVRTFTGASAAPEQLAGCRTGPWTDVYALGLLLTEMLTDRAPVGAHEAHERHRIAFAETRPTPARLGVDVGAWEPVLARALAVKPADRQRDARTLLEELDRAMQSECAAAAVSAGALAERAEQLLLELGEGFAVVGRPFHLEVGGERVHLDLLLYHLKLRRFVVVEIEPVSRAAGITDRLSARLAAVDAKLRHPDDAPSIGLRLRDTTDGLVVAYALADGSRVKVARRRQSPPRLVASLPEDLTAKLPAAEELRARLRARGAR